MNDDAESIHESELVPAVLVDEPKPLNLQIRVRPVLKRKRTAASFPEGHIFLGTIICYAIGLFQIIASVLMISVIRQIIAVSYRPVDPTRAAIVQGTYVALCVCGFLMLLVGIGLREPGAAYPFWGRILGLAQGVAAFGFACYVSNPALLVPAVLGMLVFAAIHLEQKDLRRKAMLRNQPR
ncbi:hypothetical protein AB1L30_03255 [Bremerella sp. JC817]|uniref:hypothetical protein n=1 Tax=Bremerella sp. JC817 TaxID=3231756 RepID=UPI00345ABF05